MLPVNARQAHMEMGDTPMVDKGGYVMLGSDDFLLRLMAAGEDQKLINDYVAWTLDHGSRASTESSLAKLICGETLFQIVDRCVQVLGGLGVTDDTPVHQIFRDIRAFRIYDGPSEVHRWSIAKRIKREHAAAQISDNVG